MDLIIKYFLATMLEQSAVYLSLYVLYVFYKYGVQKSVSWSFFEMKHDLKWTFRFVVIFMAISISYTFQEWYFYVGTVLMSLVGLFPRCESGWKRVVHLMGAIGGFTWFFISICIEDLKIGLFATAFGILLSMYSYLIEEVENKTWTIEIILAIALYAAMELIKYLPCLS